MNETALNNQIKEIAKDDTKGYISMLIEKYGEDTVVCALEELIGLELSVVAQNKPVAEHITQRDLDELEKGDSFKIRADLDFNDTLYGYDFATPAMKECAGEWLTFSHRNMGGTAKSEEVVWNFTPEMIAEVRKKGDAVNG